MSSHAWGAAGAYNVVACWARGWAVAIRPLSRSRAAYSPDWPSETPRTSATSMPRRRRGGASEGASGVGGDDVNQPAALAAAELHLAVSQREQRVVAAPPHVVTGVEPGAALAQDDRTGGDGLTVEGLDAQPLGVGIAAVA